MIVAITKRCKCCSEVKPLTGFYANARGKMGFHSLCKACLDAKKRAGMARNLARGDARIPESKSCGMCCRTLPASDFSRYAPASTGLRGYCRDCDRVVRRSGKYGLTRERVSEMLRQTRCDACLRPFAADSEKHVDHRHSDGAVRGVLCSRCNTTLGQCEDSGEILMRLCQYLDRTESVDHRTQPYFVTESADRDIDHVGDGMSLPPKEHDQCQTKLSNP